MSQRQRRKLSTVDDPLEPTAELAAAAPSRPRAGGDRSLRASGEELQALFVRLAATEAESLARAAFELRLHKREIVAALIYQHVDARSDDGLDRVARMVEDYRDARS